MGLFSWEEIDNGDTKLNARLKRRIEQISDAPTLESLEGNVAATKRIRTIGLASAQKSISKFVNQALRPPDPGTVVLFGEADPLAVQNDGLFGPVDRALTPLDLRVEKLLQLASKSGKGSENALSDFPADEKIDRARKEQMVRKLRAIMFKEHQKFSRLKKIKSKAFRKHQRIDVAKQKKRLLEQMDPEDAAKVKEEYELKRAEMRMMKQQTARRKWAQLAARFGGKDTAAIINATMRDEKDHKELLNVLSGRKQISEKANVSGGRDSEEEGDSDSEDSDDELTAEERKAKLLLETEKQLKEALADINAEVDAQGIQGMKFMQMARDRKKADAKAEVEYILKLLHRGHSIDDALAAAAEANKDDFVRGNNEEEDPEKKGLDFLERKRKAAKQKQSEEHNEKAVHSAEKDSLSAGDPPSTSHESDMTKSPHKERSRTKGKAAKIVSLTDYMAAPVETVKLDDKVKDAKKQHATQKVVRFTDEVDDERDDNLIATNSENSFGMVDNQQLVRQAFAVSDESGKNWSDEQAQAAAAEQQKIADSAKNSKLAGWGSWAGEGVVEKVKEGDDAIIPEVTVRPKKVVYSHEDASWAAKYRPKELPYPFVTAQQMEHNLALPLGKEWVPDDSHRKSIQPSALIRAGTVISAMRPQRRLAARRHGLA